MFLRIVMTALLTFVLSCVGLRIAIHSKFDTDYFVLGMKWLIFFSVIALICLAYGDCQYYDTNSV